MDDETSNDVEAVEYIDSQDEDDPDVSEKRPIMLLLRRLIRNKQNTVMTNAQIVDILQSEFGISINSSHELEVDIYIKIIKKYLKDWPQWEELERISTKLSNIKEFDAITKVLEHKYKNLKQYLGVMLEAAKPLAKEALKSIETETVKTVENIDKSDVVMEIQCTREQLNHLFYRRPRTDLNNTVFNMSPQSGPSRISLKTMPFEDILNLWCTKVYIKLPYFLYMREVMYKLKHTLVNKVRNEGYSQDISQDTDIYMKPVKKCKEYDIQAINNQFNDILKDCKDLEIYPVIHCVFNILRKDLKEMPTDKIQVPCTYRRYANKYKYVRYLYAENEQSKDAKYDLQLEEMVAPTYQFYIGKMGTYEKPVVDLIEWLKIECMFCKVKFSVSVNLNDALQSHYYEFHQEEPDWQCTNCLETFSMEHLAKNKWKHNC